MENKDLLAERKAKLAQLRGELYVHDRDITSAPSLTVVDEFQEDFSAADRRSGLVDGGKQGQIDEHKIFYAEINSRKESDFEFNNLINEANRRGGKDQGSGKASEDFRNGKNSGSFADDTDNDEDSFSSRPNSKGNSSSGSEGISSSLSQQFSTDKSLNLGSSITKVYQNGKYINSNEDQGYQSSASSPNETKRNRTKENRTGRSENGLLKVERGVDNLSQSLPETFLKSVKVDLSQSVNGTQDKSRSKVVYDPRIFGTAPDSSVPTIAEDDVEKDYFNKMNVFNGKDSDRKPHKEERKNSFRQFLSESFKDGTQEMKPTQESLQRKESRRTNLHLAPVPEGHRVIGEPSPLECIDLGDPVYSGSKDGSKTARSRSPTLSCKTEFTDPDHRGRSGLRRSRGSKGFSLKIPGLKKKVDIGQCGSRKRRPSLDGSEFGESWNYRPTPCETCSHRKTSTCYGVLALLAVDVLTICLILILFNKMHHHYEGLGLVQGRIGEFPDRHRHPEQQWGPEGRLDPEKIQGDQGNIGDQGYTGDLENQTNPHVNFTLDPDQGIDEKQISPRSLEPRTAPDPDLVEELRQKLENLTAQVNAMVMPPTFSCHRTTSVKDESIITYNACSIQTPGMNARTGRFRVEQDGVYQFTFTGLFVAVRGHMLSVDLFLERSGGSRPEIIGRSSGMVKEDTVFGISRDDDLHATTSVIIFQRLNKNDEVYVAMLIDGTKGDSHLQSDFSKKIHFTGLKISN